MNDRDFDELARRALAVEHQPSPEVWERSAPKSRLWPWVPSLGEIGGATVVAAVCLGAIWITTARPAPAAEALTVHDRPAALSSSDSAYYAFSRMHGASAR